MPSRPYLEMTLGVLRDFGARIERVERVERAASGEPRAEAETLRIRGPLVAPADPWTVEPDASSAAVALAVCDAGELGLLVSNGLLARKRAGLEAAAPAVRRVELANQLVMRM